MCHKLCSSPREGEILAASACVSGSRSPGAAAGPALSCFGEEGPKTSRALWVHQSSRTGEKMGTGHSLAIMCALCQGRDYGETMLNVPTPSVWLTSLTWAQGTLNWFLDFIKGTIHVLTSEPVSPSGGIRVFPVYHLSHHHRQCRHSPLNLENLLKSSFTLEQKSFSCFRQPDPLPLTSLFAICALRRRQGEPLQ